VSGWRQRVHDTTEADRARAQQLLLGEMRDLQTIRDRQLDRLREDLKLTVSALIDLAEAVRLFQFESQRGAALQIWEAASKAYREARSGLIVEPLGDPVARRMGEIDGEIHHLQLIIESWRAKAQAGSVDTADWGEQVFAKHNAIQTLIMDTMGLARDAVENLSCAVTEHDVITSRHAS